MRHLTLRSLLLVGAVLAAVVSANDVDGETLCKTAESDGDKPVGNCLGRESSPYLQLHAKDPVNWRPWSEGALKEARVTGRLIFLSIGYSACHWCHVMQRENFENMETARLMNENFVNVLVDREERPDIDQRYQLASSAMNFPTGWPLNLILTADGLPIFAGTYFPPEPRQGIPAFSKILGTFAEINREDPAAIAAQSSKVIAYLQNAVANIPGKLSRRRLENAAAGLIEAVDPFHGGFGQSAKFHNVWALRVLWRTYLRTGKPRFRQSVTLSLENMIDGGLYDHIGGGFFRYTEDPAWNVPHFEKMLDVNAQILELMVDVWRETRSPRIELRIRETVQFLLREMRLPHGGFASAIDSDSEGREGAFYVWKKKEIDTVLGESAALFGRVYGIETDGNWKDDLNVLTRNETDIVELSKEFGLGVDEIEAELLHARKQLYRHRDQRRRPLTDDKLLGDWNGLAISALAEAGLALREKTWIVAAQKAYETVQRTLLDKGGLRHSWRGGVHGPPGLLDDYASLARAALTLFEATGERRYKTDAEGWVSQARAFRDTSGGGYFQSASNSAGRIPRLKVGYDEQVPSANAILASVMGGLFYFTGQDQYRANAEATLEAFLGAAERDPLGYGALLTAADRLLAAVQIVIVGERGGNYAEALLATVWRTGIPGRVLQVIAPNEALPDGHPASGKGQVDARPTAYVCVGTFCSLPVVEPGALASALRSIRQRGLPVRELRE